MRSLVDYLSNNENKHVVIICQHQKERQYLLNEICYELGDRRIFCRNNLFVEVRATQSGVYIYPLSYIEKGFMRGYHFDYLLISDSISYIENERALDYLEALKASARFPTAKYISKTELDRWDEINKKWEDHVNE